MTIIRRAAPYVAIPALLAVVAALAFVIFGGWHPLRVALACYLYRGLLYVAGEFQVEFPDLVQVLTQLPFLLMILMITLINTEWFHRVGDRFPRWRNFLASNAPGSSTPSGTFSDVTTYSGKCPPSDSPRWRPSLG